MINRIHGGHDGEQNLRRTNVAGGLLASDVLLTSLQRKSIRRPTRRILRDADQATGQTAFQGVFHRHECRMRTAETQRHAETLTVPHTDVSAKLTRCTQQRQRQQICRHNEKCANRVHSLGQSTEIMHGSEGVWILDKNSGETVRRKISLKISDLDVNTDGTHASANHIDVLRMTLI